MRHAVALALKLTAYLVIFGVAMTVFGKASLSQSMVVAAVQTLLLWFADLVLLPRFGTKAATAADFMVLVVLTPLIMGAMHAFPKPMGLTLAATAATAFEWWFHRNLAERGILTAD